MQAVKPSVRALRTSSSILLKRSFIIPTWASPLSSTTLLQSLRAGKFLCCLFDFVWNRTKKMTYNSWNKHLDRESLNNLIILFIYDGYSYNRHQYNMLYTNHITFLIVIASIALLGYLYALWGKV